MSSDLEKTVDEIFDNLVKSRFIEMFGGLKQKKYPTKYGYELFKFSSGKFLEESKRMTEGIPVYGGNGITWYTDIPLLAAPTIIIGRVGIYCGNVRLVKDPCWITDNAIYIKSFLTNDLEIEFVEHLMVLMNFNQHSNESAQPKITQKPLEESEYIIPPKEKQKEFIRFCNQVDKSKLIFKQLVSEFDQLVKSRFIELISRYENEVDYVHKYNDICEIITDGEHSTPTRADQGIYLLSARNVVNHAIDLEDVDHIPENEYERISKRIKPRAGDILISCSGTVGRVCSVPDDLTFQMVRSVALLRLKEGINNIFFEWLVDSSFTQNQIANSIHQSAQANLFQGKIRNLVAIIPPEEEQIEFAKFVQQVDKSKLMIKELLESISG